MNGVQVLTVGGELSTGDVLEAGCDRNKEVESMRCPVSLRPTAYGLLGEWHLARAYGVVGLGAGNCIPMASCGDALRLFHG